MHPTTETRRELKLSMKESLRLLKQLADEIRVDLHLGGMEARERWTSVDEQIRKAEELARRAAAASQEGIAEATKAVKAFKEWFDENVRRT